MSIAFVCLLVLTLFSTADGISCIICNSGSSSSCGETYTADSTSSSTVAGYNSCFKTVYTSSSGSNPVGFVTRGGYIGTSTCLNTATGSSTIYCCSDKDNCNGSMETSASILLALLSLISLLYR